MTKLLAAVAVLALFPQAKPAPEITAAKVAQLPAVDGKADDAAWGQAKELAVKIDAPSELENPRKSMTLKAVHDGTSVCFLLVWSDPDKSDSHLPFVWKEDKGEYEVNDEEIEDAASLAFALEGPFDPDMLAGKESKWDVWEWGAMRSSGGYARDKYHIYSKSRPEPPVKSKRFSDRQEKPIFLARPEDEGTSAARKLEPPGQKKGAKVPQFEIQKPDGSAADVEARGVWAGGKWTLEMKRKLKVGHKDDADFDPAKPIDFAVAVFDKSEHSDHEVSGRLVLKFAP